MKLLNYPTMLLLPIILSPIISCTNNAPIILVCKMYDLKDESSNPRLATSTFILRPDKHEGTMIINLSDFVENGSLEIKEHAYVITFKNLNNAQATIYRFTKDITYSMGTTQERGSCKIDKQI